MNIALDNDRKLTTNKSYNKGITNVQLYINAENLSDRKINQNTKTIIMKIQNNYYT